MASCTKTSFGTVVATELPSQLEYYPASRKLMAGAPGECYFCRMILKTLFGTTFALGLTTFATAGYVSIASIAGVETVITESANTDRNPEDMASFVTAVTDAVVLFDNAAEQHYSDPDIRYQKHIGLGFAISMTNINPLKGGCSGNGQFGDSLGNNREYTLDGSMGCGEPSPAD